jgi:hypothetical protein
MTRPAVLRLSAAGLAGVAFLGLALRFTTPRSEATDTPHAKVEHFGKPANLPRPSSLPLKDFEEKLFAFLNDRQYQKLGWAVDKGVRDTGPFINGKYFGTHPAVRVWYSPGVMKWLVNGRQGPIPDGEMIVKEQFAPPAARHEGKSESELWDALESWTVMVKDSAGSHDGWFWSNPTKGQCATDQHQYPFEHPASGFGIYCVRCHASAHTPGTEPAAAANEYTFISLRNVSGFPGEPIRFRVDDSWRADDKKPNNERTDAHPKCVRPERPKRPDLKPNQAFAAFFEQVKLTAPADAAHLPPLTHDHVVPRRENGTEFVTSDQCMSCHAGLVAPFGPSMFVPFGKSAGYGEPGWDVSPFGEWRWTPMGLAGRDPVFFAQVESELRLIQKEFGSDPKHAKALADALVSTCTRCHGAMGKRQFDLDHPDGNETFSLDHMHATSGPHAKYGALARDGVSCAVCHRMQPKPQPADDKRPYLQFFLETQITGNFHLGPKGDIYGPFKDNEVSPYVMEHATGWKPKHNEFLKSSRLCGSCHTVALPAIDSPLSEQELTVVDEVRKTQTVELFQKCYHHVEQATYLEWLNSEYENELHPDNPKAKSCQDCHMPMGLTDERNGINLAKLKTRIAAVQDTSYPEAENLAPQNQLNVRLREDGYRRHGFAGLNAFLIELFRQHDDVLGVRKVDFMTGSKLDADNAIAAIARTAGNDVADLEVTATPEGPNRLTAKVLVKNKVGHRFPSGVGFRRAFIELAVVRPAKDGMPEQVVWASGRTNEIGVLVGPDGNPLPTEFFTTDPRTGKQQYQPHHEVIDSESQVQVYETLVRNKKGELTTSFVRGCETAKDNRLLPRGWKKTGAGPELTGRFLEATHPDAETLKDPRYADGSGTDEVMYRIALPAGVEASGLSVRATLYYQALPPYYLANLFGTAADGPATRRLHSLIGHLDLKGTPIEGWKLKLTSATAEVGKRP